MESWIRTYDFLVHVPFVSTVNPNGIRRPIRRSSGAVDERLDRELGDRGLEAVSTPSWLRLRPAQLPCSCVNISSSKTSSPF